MTPEEALHLLELRAPVTPAELRTAYRTLSKVWHPDRFAEPEMKQLAERRQQQLNEAYKVLIHLNKGAPRGAKRPATSAPSTDRQPRAGSTEVNQARRARQTTGGPPQVDPPQPHPRRGPSPPGQHDGPSPPAGDTHRPSPTGSPSRPQTSGSRLGGLFADVPRLLALICLFTAASYVFRTVRHSRLETPPPVASQAQVREEAPAQQALPAVGRTPSRTRTVSVGENATPPGRRLGNVRTALPAATPVRPPGTAPPTSPSVGTNGQNSASPQGVPPSACPRIASRGVVELGDSEERVRVALGPPDETRKDAHRYGRAWVYFKEGSVSGWVNPGRTLLFRVAVPPGTPPPCLGVGDAVSAVVALLGAPEGIIGEKWFYGFCALTVENGRVAASYCPPGSEVGFCR